MEQEGIIAFTDGSSYYKTKLGGWAFRVMLGDRRFERWGCAENTTGNDMELTAILRVLQFVKPSPHRLTIYTDSEFAKNALTTYYRGWRLQDWRCKNGEPVKNAERVKECVEWLDKHAAIGRHIDIFWIEGHADRADKRKKGIVITEAHRHNIYVDGLAGIAYRDRVTNWDDAAVWH